MIVEKNDSRCKVMATPNLRTMLITHNLRKRPKGKDSR